MQSIEANVAGTGYCRLGIEDGTIVRVERLGGENADAPHCSPGFVDLQINGFAGVDFSDPNLSVGAVAQVLPALWATGVTSFCPTLITNTLERLERNFAIFEAARRVVPSFAECVPCYHLEGPYLSPGFSRGAHDPNLMRSPDWDEFQRLQRAAGGNIGILTLAPELPGAHEFIRRVSDTGVIVAISHTDGGPDDVHGAAAAGATLNTHLGNGCPPMLHRHLAPFWAQLADDRLHASIICDGFHLTPEMVQIIHRMKGLDRCILVTDAVHVATLAPGRYSLVGREIELLPSGQVVTADRRSMAGSTLSMDAAISLFMSLTGANLADSLRPATLNPAKILARPSVCQKITVGAFANLTLFRLEAGRLRIERTLCRGNVVHALPRTDAVAVL